MKSEIKRYMSGPSGPYGVSLFSSKVNHEAPPLGRLAFALARRPPQGGTYGSPYGGQKRPGSLRGAFLTCYPLLPCGQVLRGKLGKFSPKTLFNSRGRPKKRPSENSDGLTRNPPPRGLEPRTLWLRSYSNYLESRTFSSP